MLKERVFKTISRVMNVPLDVVNENSSPDNIEPWDSLAHMNLVLALEEELKVKFTDDELAEMTNADIILKVLETKKVNPE